MTAGASNSPVFDFTSLDFESANEDLIRYAQTTFTGEQWTDFNDSNAGTQLIEELAYATDLLSYTANAQALETIVTTLIREQNFRNIAKSLDYTLNSAAPSRGSERLTLDVAGIYPFTVSKHLQFATITGTIFQPDADTAVAAYPVLGYVDVDITQGEEHFEEVIGTTSGQPSQEFDLGTENLIDGTLVVQFGLEAYTQVSNFIEAAPTDKVYVIQTDEAGITTIIAGDGINGTIPPKNQTAKATYKTGGGIDTNLALGAVSRIYGTSDGSATPAQVLSVTNIASVTGGASKQSLANAKQNLPLSLKANDRAVTLGDYAALAVDLVPGILKASAVAGKAQGGTSPILLFVVPNGGGNPSDSLRNLTIVNLKDKRLAGKRIRVLDPVYVRLYIESDTFVSPNSPALDVANKQRSILAAKYDIELVDFGDTFDLQDVYDDTAPSVLQGIRRVFYRTFTVLPYYARHVNSPTTGNGTVEWIAADEDTVRRREWLIQILSPLGPVSVPRVQVKQRHIGTITSVTDALATDESANYEPSSLSTWVFHPRPEDNATTYAILGNTATTITTAAGLLTTTEPDDPYAIEKTEATIGKVLRTTVALAATATATIQVASTDSWQVGDPLHFSDVDDEYYTVVNILATPPRLVLDRVATTALGAFVDYVWVSADGSIKFSVVNGTTSFVLGDELYVDTYPRTGDIILRPENFPLLDDANLVINPIGGAR